MLKSHHFFLLLLLLLLLLLFLLLLLLLLLRGGIIPLPFSPQLNWILLKTQDQQIKDSRLEEGAI